MLFKSFAPTSFILSVMITSSLACTKAAERAPMVQAETKSSQNQSPYHGKKLPNLLELDGEDRASLGADDAAYSENNPPSTLPIINASYEADDGCYVACYSRDEKNSAYKLSGEDIYVMGLFRLQGAYEDRICRPKEEGQGDISAMDHYKKACGELLPEACNAESLNCWTGGDTGGFFGYVDDSGATKGE